ncbi:beta strand repeat-containing protein [Paraburkholderia flava]|uniref:beta strand repeat-containing protein n=1 Tax=Paraburkholderia flava TaxID=2547393 RepID=UPI00105F1C11|nr:matrixin family metalloprotease [Paraburkholderia flava]
MTQDNLNNAITATSAIWGGKPPSQDVLTQINNSSLLVQSINQYDNAIQDGTAAPIGTYFPQDGSAYSNGKETIVNDNNQVQILLGTIITSSTDTGVYISALTYEMGKFSYFNQGQELYNAVANLNPNDPNYGNAAAVVGTTTEAWSAAFSYQVQQQMASAPGGATFTIDGDEPGHANGAIEQTLNNAWQGQNLSNASSADAFAALTTAALNVIGTFPAIGSNTYPEIYQNNAVALQDEYGRAGLNGVTTNPPADITGIVVNDSNGNLSSSTLTFQSGEHETLAFTGNQVSSATYTDASGNIISNISYVHNADGSYTSTVKDTTGAVVSTQQFSSNGSEVDTVTNVNTAADVNASGVTLTTNANTIDVNGPDYDTTILNGGHVINAQAGDTFQLTGVGYNVNLSATGPASTITFNESTSASIGSVNGSGATINVNDSNDVFTPIDWSSPKLTSLENAISGGNSAKLQEFEQYADNSPEYTKELDEIVDGQPATLGAPTTWDTDSIDVNGSNDSILNATGGTTTITGDGDTLTSYGFGGTVNVSGQGDTFDGSNVTINSQDGTSLTVDGSANSVSGGSDSTIDIEGSGDTLTSVGGGSTVDVSGFSQTVDASSATINGEGQFAINGSSDSIDLDAPGDTATVNGSSDTINSSIQGSDFTVSGQDDILNVSGGSIDDANASSILTDTLSVNGSGDTISDRGDDILDVSGGSNVLETDAGSTIDISGENNSIYSSSTTVEGQNSDSLYITGSSNIVSDGQGSTTTIDGNDNTLSSIGASSIVDNTGQNNTIDLDGSSSTTNFSAGSSGTVDGAGDTVNGQGSDSLTINGSGDTITDGASSTTNIDGNDDTLSDVGAGSTVGVSGQNYTVDLISDSNSLVNLAADSSGTVNGSGNTVDLTGNGITVNASDDTFTHAAGISGDIVDGSNDSGVMGVSGLDYIDSDSGNPTGGGDDGGGDDGGGDDGGGDDGGGDDGGGDGSGGYYGGYGFSGNRNAVQKELSGGSISGIAQYDLNQGNDQAAMAAQGGFRQAAEMARDTATSAGTGPNVLEGARWSADTITWSLSSLSGIDGASFSGQMSSQYETDVENAFATWAAASGLKFQEVSDASQADINIGWGNLNTATTGEVGYTGYRAAGGVMSSAAIELENPTQDALASGADGALTYSTGATLSQVLLHEIGHALGLADNADQGSVMNYDLTSTNQTLDSTDINAIQTLYGSSAQTAALIQAMAGQAPSSSASSTSNLPAEQASQHVQLVAGTH